MGKPRDTCWGEVVELEGGKWECKHCHRICSGTATRIRAHLLGIKGLGIEPCTEAPKNFQIAVPSTSGSSKDEQHDVASEINNNIISDSPSGTSIDSINEKEKRPMEAEVPGCSEVYPSAANELIGEGFEACLEEMENWLMADEEPEEEIHREKGSEGETEDAEEIQVAMPGFSFKPTDQEIVTHYLAEMIAKAVRFELIRVLNMSKYDPWDLPKIAGMKESYFFSPRCPEYRDSGFWKPIGNDEPIISSEGKCVGLKKSLVYHWRGRETDWMMHEYRLPDSASPPREHKHKRKSLSPTDSWTICKIFRKGQSNSLAANSLHSPVCNRDIPDSFLPSNFESSEWLNQSHLQTI